MIRLGHMKMIGLFLIPYIMVYPPASLVLCAILQAHRECILWVGTITTVTQLLRPKQLCGRQYHFHERGVSAERPDILLVTTHYSVENFQDQPVKNCHGWTQCNQLDLFRRQIHHPASA